VSADGRYAAFSGSQRVSAFPDRFEIDRRPVPYYYVTNVAVRGNVLEIAYVGADKRPVELYYRYDTFLPGRGPRELMQLLDRVRSSISHLEYAAPAEARPQQIIRAEGGGAPIAGRHEVVVNATRVAFPPICPACGMLAETIATLKVDNGISDYGCWYVPICNAHRGELRKHVRVSRWSARGRSVKFSFTNGQYAAEFLAMNQGEHGEELARMGESTRLAYDIDHGVRFVAYRFAIGAFRISFLGTSAAKRIEPGQSRRLRGLPYSLVSLIFGWWSLVGPIFTIRSLVTNWRGGFDLTQLVRVILAGQALSPLGPDNVQSDVALL